MLIREHCFFPSIAPYFTDDREAQVRTAKPSATVMSAIASANAIPAWKRA